MGKIKKGTTLTYPSLSVFVHSHSFFQLLISEQDTALLGCSPLSILLVSPLLSFTAQLFIHYILWSCPDTPEFFLGVPCLDFPAFKQLIFDSQVSQSDPPHTVTALVTLLTFFVPRNFSEVFLYLFQDHRYEYQVALTCELITFFI